jgi:Glycosyltransferase family 87
MAISIAKVAVTGRWGGWLSGDWLRPCGLVLLAAMAGAGYWTLGPITSGGVGGPAGVVIAEALVAVPYALACWLVVSGRRPTDRRWRAVEWVGIIGGACTFFAAVFPLQPLLSADLYRYVWDARLISHGFSPYLAAPESAIFQPLRDGLIYPHLYWVHVPTIYPPGAQGLFFIAYFIAPSNIFAVKAEMLLFVAATAVALGWYLHAHAQDPRRTLIFLWCPLVVVELGMNGHVDAAAIALWMMALVLGHVATRPGARVAVGTLLALATLVKLYPAILLLGLGRRRDRGLYVAFGATLALGYAPFLSEGLRASGFLPTYLRGQDYGGVLLAIHALLSPLNVDTRLIQGIGALLAALAIGAVIVGRARGALQEELAVLALVVTWLALSPHVFPWYATALAPLCALLLRAPSDSWMRALQFGLWACSGAFLLCYLAAGKNGPQWTYGATYATAVLAMAIPLLEGWRLGHRPTVSAAPGGTETSELGTAVSSARIEWSEYTSHREAVNGNERS